MNDFRINFIKSLGNGYKSYDHKGISTFDINECYHNILMNIMSKKGKIILEKTKTHYIQFNFKKIKYTSNSL